MNLNRRQKLIISCWIMLRHFHVLLLSYCVDLDTNRTNHSPSTCLREFGNCIPAIIQVCTLIFKGLKVAPHDFMATCGSGLNRIVLIIDIGASEKNE